MGQVIRPIGDVLQELRKKKGLQQQALAELLNIRPTYLSEIENNRKQPSEKLFQQICQALGIDSALVRFLALGESAVPESKKQIYKMLAPQVREMIYMLYLDKDPEAGNPA